MFFTSFLEKENVFQHRVEIVFEEKISYSIVEISGVTRETAVDRLSLTPTLLKAVRSTEF